MIWKNANGIFSAQRTPFLGRICRRRALLAINDKVLRGGQAAIFGVSSTCMILNDLNGAERWNDWNALNERCSSAYKSASAGITSFPINSIGVIC